MSSNELLKGRPSLELPPAPPGTLRPLEEAMIGVIRATDSRGLKIILMSQADMFDVGKVCAAIKDLASKLDDFVIYFDGDEFSEPGKVTAARHLGLLANLYAELVKVRSTPPATPERFPI